jgi:hypothetical protein
MLQSRTTIGTHNDAIPKNQVAMPKETQAEKLRPRKAQRADIIPTEDFAMVVDGKLKVTLSMSKPPKRRVKNF